MGTSRCDYVMVAVYFPEDSFEEFVNSELKLEELNEIYRDNPYDEKIHSHNSLTLVSDGMNGEYTFFGSVYKKSNEEGCGFGVIDLEDAKKIKYITTKRIKEAFKGFELDLEFKVKTYVFSHWH